MALDGRPSPSSKAENLPAEAIVSRYEEEEVLRDHPFLRRLAREPVDVSVLWLIMANFWEGVVLDFPKRLAHIVAKVDDDRIRCIVAKQLHDELGEGDFNRAHKAMFRKLVAALEPHRPAGEDDVLLAPGRRLSQALGTAIFSADPYVSIGAQMMLEIYGKQVDILLADQFRRQNAIDPSALGWLHLHEELEVDHADDSRTLASLIPVEGVRGAWSGADAVADASRDYFDELYRVAFP